MCDWNFAYHIGSKKTCKKNTAFQHPQSCGITVYLCNASPNQIKNCWADLLNFDKANVVTILFLFAGTPLKTNMEPIFIIPP